MTFSFLFLRVYQLETDYARAYSYLVLFIVVMLLCVPQRGGAVRSYTLSGKTRSKNTRTITEKRYMYILLFNPGTKGERHSLERWFGDLS